MRFRPFRGAIRFLSVLWTALQACIHFVFLRWKNGIPLAADVRAEWLHVWCGLLLRRLGVEAKYEGRIPSRGLIVCNHLSYLDIIVLSSICPCTFVAKKEVRLWPVFGWMATMSGTVFVDRQRPRETGTVNDQLEIALRSGLRVVLFPEGTSTNGTEVLPFRSPLFASAIAAGEPITPAYIKYSVSEGSVEQDVCYWGDMTFLPHLLRAVQLPHIDVVVRFTPEPFRFDDRKQAAEITREQVVALAQM
ncbi:MAG: phospholipid/glycerol acyltransferase [Acidobacteriales bacterium]|nr:phospholipid/glycerol acyltransferase [Terriglobales bacterium]